MASLFVRLLPVHHTFQRRILIYGGLTALCLIMLWLYFCMIILLCGAEINKLFFAGTTQNPSARGFADHQLSDGTNA